MFRGTSLGECGSEKLVVIAETGLSHWRNIQKPVNCVVARLTASSREILSSGASSDKGCEQDLSIRKVDYDDWELRYDTEGVATVHHDCTL